MNRIDTPNRAINLWGAGKDGWKDGNQSLGINATELDAAFFNAIQEEIAGVIEAQGITLDPNNRAQLLLAIQKLIEARVGDYSLDTGTANAKVVALNPVIAAYTGDFFGTFKNAVLNTGACTINFGPGAVPLVAENGAALAGGDLPAGYVVGYQYVNADAKAYVTTLIQSQGDARYLLQNNSTVGLVETFGAPGSALNRRYNDITNITGMQYAGANINAEFMTVNNTSYNTGTGIWAGRDVAGPCFAVVVTDPGQKLYYYAPSGAAGAAPVWSLIVGFDLSSGATYGIPSVPGLYKNLQSSATGISASIAETADSIVVEDGYGLYKLLEAVNNTINSAAVGANGLDTGVLAASTWYAKFVIYNPTTNTVAGLLSLSATAPTMPSGYTFKARTGWIRTDGTANKYPLSFKQVGRKFQYVVAAGGNVPGGTLMASGVAGNVVTPTWAAVGVSSFVPPTASVIMVYGLAGQNGVVGVAPNSSYGGYNSATNPPPILGIGPGSASSAMAGANGALLLESNSIYWYASVASQIYCLGWNDNF